MNSDFHELEVSAVIQETAECSSFEFQIPPALRGQYQYKAGQHLTFEIPWESFTVARCYSLSSCPDLGETLKIAVKRVKGGRVSNWMNDEVQSGDKLRVSLPEGHFVLSPDTRSAAPLFLFAGGSGITPIIALLKSALVTTKRPITLIYANQDRASAIYSEEISQLADQYSDRLSLSHHYDDDHGYMNANFVREHLHHTGNTTDSTTANTTITTTNAEFYICGPGAFMELIETTLEAAGVREELIHVERFVSPVDPDRAQTDSDDSIHSTEIETLEAPEKFSLWLNGRSRSVTYTRGKTLLECAYDAGLNPPHSCQSGFCGSCMAHVKSGTIHMRTHEALSERDIARGAVLMCQSFPASSGPLELDADVSSFRTASAAKSAYSQRVLQLAAVAVFAFMIAGTLILRSVQ